MGLALYYAELWSPARYYKEAIRLNSISEIRERIAIWTAWYTFIKERNFTSFQSVYGCLSVYRHNVSPRFHNHCLCNCLCQLSSCLFVSILRDTIVYGDIEVYCDNVKHCVFSKSCILCPRFISLHNSRTKQPIDLIFSLHASQLHDDILISGLSQFS